MQQEDAARGMGLTARSTVAATIRQQIIDGSLAPGTALSEVSLSEQFGVSRTPVREALKQLQTEGLITVRPRVGTFVTMPSLLEINELFEIKEILEGAAARLLAMRGTVPELEMLRANMADQRASVSDGDVARYSRLAAEFHDVVLKGSGNRKLQEHHRMMMNQMLYLQFVQLSLRQTGRIVESDSEHEAILSAIESRDALNAERNMRLHVRSSQEALMNVLNEAHSAGGAVASAALFENVPEPMD